MSDGSIMREAINGSLFIFTSGTKTISLVVAAEWYSQISRVQSAPLFSDIPSLHFQTTLQRFQSSGLNAVGQSAAVYMRDPDQTALTVIGQSWVNALTAGEQAAASVAVLAILNRVRVKDADGIWWVIDDGAQTVDAGHFGAVSDASENYGAGTVSGTGNADAIQALIDWRVYLRQGTPSGEQECLIPAGMYRVERGLQLGYGDDFRTVRLRGAGGRRVAAGRRCGSILPTSRGSRFTSGDQAGSAT